MPTIALRRFTNTDTLQRIAPAFLIEVLSPHAAFLEKRGLVLPASAEAGRIDYEKLARIFMMPDTDMPREFADALFHIHEMSTKEGMDCLQEAAERRGLDLGLNGEAS